MPPSTPLWAKLVVLKPKKSPDVDSSRIFSWAGASCDEVDELDFNLFDLVNLSRRGTAERSNGTRVPSGDSSEDPAKAVIGQFLPKYYFRSLRGSLLEYFCFGAFPPCASKREPCSCPLGPGNFAKWVMYVMCLISFNCAMSFVLQCYEDWLIAKIFEFCLLTPPWLARWKQRAPAPWAWSRCSPLGNVKHIQSMSFGLLKTWRKGQIWSLTTATLKRLSILENFVTSWVFSYVTKQMLWCPSSPGLKSQAQHDVWWEIVLANTKRCLPILQNISRNWLRDGGETLRHDLCLCCRRTRRRTWCPIERSSRRGSAFVWPGPSQITSILTAVRQCHGAEWKYNRFVTATFTDQINIAQNELFNWRMKPDLTDHHCTEPKMDHLFFRNLVWTDIWIEKRRSS